MKEIFAFLIGLAGLWLLYSYIYIPVLPCAVIYATGFLFLAPGKKRLLLRIILVIALTVTACYLYVFNVFFMINFYPEAGNVLAIIFECITVFAIIGSSIFISNGLITEYKNS